MVVKSDRTLLARLTAVWALSESALGGILHGLKIPFTGMVVSSIAVFSILMMIRSGAGRGDLFKALMIVAAVKAMVSPHSPPTAYMALFFQGGLAMLMLSLLQKSPAAGYLLLFLALMESGLQKIIVLTLIFGRDLWSSIDVFAAYLYKSLLPQSSGLSFSIGFGIIAVYLAIHALYFLLGAFWFRRFIKSLETFDSESITIVLDNTIRAEAGKRKKRLRLSWLIYPLAIVLMALTFIYPVFESSVGWRALRMVLRSVILLSLWYGLAGPLVVRWMRKRINSHRQQYSAEIDAVLDMLPVLKKVFMQVWRRHHRRPGRKLSAFLRELLLTLLFARITVGRDEQGGEAESAG